MKLATLLAAAGALLAAVAAPPATASPHPGSLDRAFSGDGILSRAFGEEPVATGARKLALQPDGSALTLLASGRGFAIARFTPGGALDPSFGGEGFLTGSFGVAGGSGSDLAVQPDGRIVVAGSAPARNARTGSRFAVARFLPDGTPDPGFGGDGNVVFAGRPAILEGEPRAVALQPDGRILLLGVANWDPRAQLEIVRLEADGSLDRSYGGDGFVALTLGKRTPCFLQDDLEAIAVHDGKLTVALDCGPDGDRVYRLNPDGSLDPGFGSDGMVEGELAVDGTDLAIAPDGGTLLTSLYWVSRLAPDGSVDTGFGEGGVAKLQQPTQLSPKSIAALPDGRVLVAGSRYTPASESAEFFLVRLTPEGSPDPSFGGGSGVVAADVAGGGTDAPAAVLPTGEGGALLTGTSSGRIALVRYRPDGALDAGFGTGGVALAGARVLSADTVFDLAEGPRGTVTAVGRGGGIAVVRYRRDGAPDPRFGGGGVVQPPVAGVAGETVLALPDGGVLVGLSHAPDGALLRLRPDGALDPGFGRGGVGAAGVFGSIIDLLRLRDGRILAAGIAAGTDRRGLMARFRPDGSLDRSFGENGSVGIGRVEEVRGRADLTLVAGGGGRLLLAVRTFQEGWLHAYTAEGERVESFGKRPGARWDLEWLERVAAVALGPDGGIVLAGRAHGHFALFRLLPGGAIDRGFGDRGKVLTKLGAGSVPSDLQIEADGRIVVAGYVKSCPSSSFCSPIAPAVVRYERDGSLDRSFARDGVWTARKLAGTVNALALGEGSILLGGWGLQAGGYRDMLLTRLHR